MSFEFSYFCFGCQSVAEKELTEAVRQGCVMADP